MTTGEFNRDKLHSKKNPEILMESVFNKIRNFEFNSMQSEDLLDVLGREEGNVNKSLVKFFEKFGLELNRDEKKVFESLKRSELLEIENILEEKLEN